MSTPESPVPSTGNTVAEQFLADELAAARRSLARTRLFGVIIVAVVATYMTIVSTALKKQLEPQAAADFATTFTAGQIMEKTDALASEVKHRIPALVAGLPEYVQRELPLHREALEDRIEEAFQSHCRDTSQQLGKHLDNFLQAHTVQIRTLLNLTDKKPEQIQALGADLDQDILNYLAEKSGDEESVKEKITLALQELQRIEQQVDRLAKNVNLTPQEKKIRYAIAVVSRSAEAQTKQLENQLKDALRKSQ